MHAVAPSGSYRCVTATLHLAPRRVPTITARFVPQAGFPPVSRPSRVAGVQPQSLLAGGRCTSNSLRYSRGVIRTAATKGGGVMGDAPAAAEYAFADSVFSGDRSGKHTSTIVFLHGLGDTGHGWADNLNSLGASPGALTLSLSRSPLSASALQTTCCVSAPLPHALSRHPTRPERHRERERVGCVASAGGVLSTAWPRWERVLARPLTRVSPGGKPLGLTEGVVWPQGCPKPRWCAPLRPRGRCD